MIYWQLLVRDKKGIVRPSPDHFYSLEGNEDFYRSLVATARTKYKTFLSNFPDAVGFDIMKKVPKGLFRIKRRIPCPTKDLWTLETRKGADGIVRKSYFHIYCKTFALNNWCPVCNTAIPGKKACVAEHTSKDITDIIEKGIDL